VVKKLKILFKIIFLLVIQLSMGTDVYSNQYIHHPVIEKSGDSDERENNFRQHTISIDEDQIDKVFNIFQPVEFLLLIPIVLNSSFQYNISLSVWQPPEIR
jgi:hypothetical protein